MPLKALEKTISYRISKEDLVTTANRNLGAEYVGGKLDYSVNQLQILCCFNIHTQVVVKVWIVEVDRIALQQFWYYINSFQQPLP